jgi:hypothetical protein
MKWQAIMTGNKVSHQASIVLIISPKYLLIAFMPRVPLPAIFWGEIRMRLM